MSETERLIELETRLAFQEHTLSELNEIVADQARDLVDLRRQLEQVLSDLRTMRGVLGADSSSEPPPPHY
jgi:SlyX protein